MADTEAPTSNQQQQQCGSCLGDKSKGCPQCLQSPDKPEPADAPKQNGTEAEAVIKSKEEQSPDPKAAEETKIQKDLKESEDPKKPEVEEQKEEKEQTDGEVKNGAKEEEVKEEEVKVEPLGPDDVVCDSCIESPCRALKSCLTCLVSYHNS